MNRMMAANARVRVEAEPCIGSGSCVRLLPDVFKLNDDDVAVVVDDQVATVEALTEAEESCPAGAIFSTAGDEAKR